MLIIMQASSQSVGPSTTSTTESPFLLQSECKPAWCLGVNASHDWSTLE